MANPDRPQGARPYGPCKRIVQMVAGAEIFPGDFVHLEDDGKVDPAAAAEDILGVALDYASADGQSVMVSCDPEQLYIVQASGSEIDAQTDIGNNCDILATAGDSTYKMSRHEADSSTLTAAGSAQLTVIAVDGTQGNALGAQVDVIVRINEHQAFGENDFAGI